MKIFYTLAFALLMGIGAFAQTTVKLDLGADSIFNKLHVTDIGIIPAETEKYCLKLQDNPSSLYQPYRSIDNPLKGHILDRVEVQFDVRNLTEKTTVISSLISFVNYNSDDNSLAGQFEFSKASSASFKKEGEKFFFLQSGHDLNGEEMISNPTAREWETVKLVVTSTKLEVYVNDSIGYDLDGKSHILIYGGGETLLAADAAKF